MSTRISKTASRRATTSAGVRERAAVVKAADVDEHHANASHFAELGGAHGEKPLDHTRRDVLTEEVNQFVAGRRGGERALEMALDRRSDIARQQPGCEKDGASRQMIADAEVWVLASPL